MPSFRYVAIGPQGEMQRGVMEADTQAEVIARLQKQGSMPMRAEPAAGGSFMADLATAEFGSRRGLGAQAVADLTRELATMLAAGQDLDRALRYLQETAPKGAARRVVTALRDAVRDGSPLAAALAQHPQSFSRLYVGLVRAGEASGRLAETLDRLAELLDSQRRLAATVTSALIYPALLLVAAIGAIVLLLTQVLPQFVPLFEQSGASLPPSTQFLIDAGDFVANDGVFVLMALGVLVLVGRVLLRRPGPRLLADRLLLRVPVVGGLTREVLAARLTRTLGTLLVNGVPLVGALAIVRDVVGNRAAAAAVDVASQCVRDGAGLSRPLESAGVFPVRTIHLLRLGEENAQLGAMALRAAAIHEERTRVVTQRLVSLLVPAITILMGAAVAGIVASLLTAMLSLNDLAAG